MKRLSTEFDSNSVNKTPRLADGENVDIDHDNQMPTDIKYMEAGNSDTERKLCYKFLAPTHLVASIMGPKGKIIQGIQAETNTLIQFSDRGFNYANTRSRLATVIGSRIEDLSTTLGKVIEHLNECMQNVKSEGDLSEINPSQMPDNFVFIMIIPKIMRGIVIGPGGAQVAELREISGCKIRLDEGMSPAESMLKIEGGSEGISKVCQWVIDQIQNVCDDESYRIWTKGHGSISTRDSGNKFNKSSRPGQVMQNNLRNNIMKVQTDDPLSGYSGFTTPPSNGGRVNTSRIQTSSNIAIPNLNSIIAKVGAEVNNENKTFTLQVPIPLDFKGALIGKGGCGVKDILHESHCATLNIQDIQGTEECSVTIEGSVMACSAAYMLVMRRFVQHSRQQQQNPPMVGRRHQ